MACVPVFICNKPALKSKKHKYGVEKIQNYIDYNYV